MEPKEEYHDPDYPGTSGSASQGHTESVEADKLDKIKVIIRREFGNELAAREEEVNLLDQRIASARHLMHRLRYTLVRSYFTQWQLEVSPAEISDEVAAQSEPRAKAEVSSILREGQKNIHPSLRKLLGKRSIDLEEIFKHREPRNKGRKNYCAMLSTKNVTTAADTTTSLRPEQIEASSSKPKKIPRQMDPKIDSVYSLNEATRNQMKDRYRIIIGNTSKYAPSASAADRSSHKWLLYVRGAQPNSAAAILDSVTVTLHASYAPHHKITLTKPPFHVSRRGWGEFPARVQLHFPSPAPARNPPAELTHTLRLDARRTGLQTLGAETVVDVWLYSTPEMLPYVYKDEVNDPISDPIQELETLANITDVKETDNSWLDFFSNSNPMNVDDLIIKDGQSPDFVDKSIDSGLKSIDYEQTIDKINEEKMQIEIPQEILNKTKSPKKKIMKYVDPSTGKVYYLEMDKNFDLSKVQEIVINPDTKISPPKLTDMEMKTTNLKDTEILTPNLKDTEITTANLKGTEMTTPNLKDTEMKTPNLLHRKISQTNSVTNAKETKLQKNGILDKSRSLLKSQNRIKIKSKNYTHIPSDHCYLGSDWAEEVNFSNLKLPDEKSVNDSVASEKYDLLDRLKSAVKKFSCVRVAVNYLLSKIPLVSDMAENSDFVRDFPFVVRNEDLYWRLDFAKRRNIEWSRAKLINTILTDNLKTTNPIWRTKQILVFSRLHGYYPFRSDKYNLTELNEDCSSQNDIVKVKMECPNESTLTIFEENYYIDSDSCVVEQTTSFSEDIDIDIDVLDDSPTVNNKSPPVLQATKNDLEVLPVNEEDRLKLMFIERKCAEIGIELRNEDIGHGFCYSAVHAVLLTAMKKFAEEMLRTALACKLTEERSANEIMPVWTGSDDSLRQLLSLSHAAAAARSPRLRVMTSRALAAAAAALEPL